jgi:tetratricopeptide (TPR) repeat protein
MGPEEDLPTLICRKDHLNILRYVRAHQLRDPNLVVTSGKILLESKSLGDAERLASLEQICIAACDIGDLDLAESCLDSIVNPSESNNKSLVVTKESARYRKLLGLCLEAAGNYESAAKVYDILLQDNPSNAYAAKRKYCILAAQPGKETDAMKALDEYLSKHPGDLAAWNQMAEHCKYEVCRSTCGCLCQNNRHIDRHKDATFNLQDKTMGLNPSQSASKTISGSAWRLNFS